MKDIWVKPVIVEMQVYGPSIFFFGTFILQKRRYSLAFIHTSSIINVCNIGQYHFLSFGFVLTNTYSGNAKQESFWSRDPTSIFVVFYRFTLHDAQTVTDRSIIFIDHIQRVAVYLLKLVCHIFGFTKN